MSDPFERLRDLQPSATAPDVDAIRDRARGIRARRAAGLTGAAGLAVAAIAVAVIARAPETRKEGLSVRDARPPAAAASEAPDDASARGAEALPSPQPPRATATALPGPPATTAPGAGAGLAAGKAPAQAAAGASETALTVTLRAQPEQASAGEGIVLTLRACNETSRAVVAAFGDGQRYDFDVTKSGQRVWRWSSDKSFVQATGTERWGPGECRSYDARWEGRDENGKPVVGRFEVTGILSSVTARRTAPRSVCVVACY